MAGHQINKNHLTAKRLDNFPAHHLVVRIVSALHKDHGPDAPNKFFRRVLVEDDDEIDGLQPGKNLGACLYRLHGTAGALQAGYRGVTVETHNETIARPSGASQQFDMARMQQIKATVGKTDAQAVAPPIGDMIL